MKTILKELFYSLIALGLGALLGLIYILRTGGF
jgi:hypothetical protein